jgi:hypothetical protein
LDWVEPSWSLLSITEVNQPEDYNGVNKLRLGGERGSSVTTAQKKRAAGRGGLSCL